MMQPLGWYLARLRVMSPEELAWRVRTNLRNQIDRVVTPLRRQLTTDPRRLAAMGHPSQFPFRLCDLNVGEWVRAGRSKREQAWCEQLIERADHIAGGRLSFFDLENHHLGDPIDWNRDHKSGRAAPMRFAATIDYRDFEMTGDCKFVWEPNRHHQLVVLARAYRATGNESYAAAAVAQLNGWIEQCPFRMGMNWRSPLELAIRLINWVWTMDLIREAHVIDQVTWNRWLQVIGLHLQEVQRNYSRGSSAGNHRVGEAAGVFIGSSYLPFLKNAAKWRRESREILEEEIVRQTFGDGGPREQALGYHLFDLQFFMLAALVGRWSGEDFSEAYWARMQGMCNFVAALQAGGETLPMFGDCDDGYVLELGEGPPSAQDLLSIAAALFPRGAFTAALNPCSQVVRWLLGQRAFNPARVAPAIPQAPIHSQAFEETGYYLLQCGASDPDDRISVVFDCGPLGLPPLAGHGHADALSFTLRAFGKDVFVDPGTHDYFSYPQWRRYFRSTRAHNTIVIDDRDQSEMLGPFLWGRPARSRCVCWQQSSDGGTVAGEHDGYTRLSRPVTHRRTIVLDGRRRELLLRDDLIGTAGQEVLFSLHLAEQCRVTRIERNSYEIDVGPGAVRVTLDPRLTVTEHKGSLHPTVGWVSRGYHHRVPATTLVGRFELEGSDSLLSRINVGERR